MNKRTARELQAVAFLGIALLSTANAVAAQYFYAVDFNGPQNQVGQPPATGMGPQTPSRIVFGSPTVVSSFGHLTDQPLLFEAINYQQIEFDLGRAVPSYFLDFDFETRNLNPSLFSFRTFFNYPSFGLHGGGYINVPPANSTPLPGWTEDELHHMHIGVDVVAGTWSFQLDNRAPATGFLDANTGDVQSIRMNLSAWRAFTPDDPTVQVAIDNIVIGTVVPEPSSCVLCAMASGLLLLLRRAPGPKPKAEPGVASNDDSATPAGNSGVSQGPPLVS